MPLNPSGPVAYRATGHVAVDYPALGTIPHYRYLRNRNTGNPWRCRPADKEASPSCRHGVGAVRHLRLSRQYQACHRWLVGTPWHSGLVVSSATTCHTARYRMVGIIRRWCDPLAAQEEIFAAVDDTATDQQMQPKPYYRHVVGKKLAMIIAPGGRALLRHQFKVTSATSFL